MANTTEPKTTSTDPLDDEKVDERETSKVLGVKVKTLQGWRAQQIGPRYYKIGSRVLYRRADLRAFLEGCAVEPRTLGGADAR
jgi:Helix-turn-helix domain